MNMSYLICHIATSHHPFLSKVDTKGKKGTAPYPIKLKIKDE